MSRRRQNARAEHGVAMRLHAYSGGFLGPSAQARRIRRILALAGHPLRLGWPGPDDAVAAWGHGPRASRAEGVAARSGAALWRIEDAFIRSIHPARLGGEAPMGLLVDRQGAHYDPSQPSALEHLLATHPLDNTPLLDRARLCMARMATIDLSKYNAHDPALEPPAPGYVLVIDQVRGDASVRHGGVGGPLPDGLFDEMLTAALDENPGARVILRTHPEAMAPHRGRRGRGGYFSAAIPHDRVSIDSRPLPPRALLQGAVAVYTVSSQMGFDAILAGHRPHVFGLPFYAGWGLSADRNPLPRRNRRLTRAQLFAAAMLLYPLWYDPLRDRLCPLEQVIDQMEARLRAFRRDRQGHVACGMRLWKRGHLQAFFGREKPVLFAADPARAAARAAATGRHLTGWASAVPDSFAGLRVEDGFLRSRGLGAALTPPVSLVVDDLGIYYDPRRDSRLERLIATPLPPDGTARAAALIQTICNAGLTKYNIGQNAGKLTDRIKKLRETRPGAPVILVPGQVEDDASIRYGAGIERSNFSLLQSVRDNCPDAVILFKPHPDVEAGLRAGAVLKADTIADLILTDTDAHTVFQHVDEVWTITSGLGFEALLRGKPVTCLGMPFYAGWGLTRDLAPVPKRRQALAAGAGPVTLERLVHAALIAYPRYLDPLTGTPCPPELIVERLARQGEGDAARGRLRAGPGLRLLARLQGAMASRAHWWR